MNVSFVEIYLEQLHDLLSISQSNGNKRSRKKSKELCISMANGSTVIKNLKSVEVHSLNALLELLKNTSALRATSSTGMNAHSSRSHYVMTVDLLQMMTNDFTKNQN